jgi:Arc/MetJ-type ribon-helix-helix transcriptional regulator
MKISISLPAEEVAVLDEYALAAALPSRSAAIRRAIRLLGVGELEQDYAAAWEDWESSGEQASWDGTVAAGVAHAAR